MPNVALSQQAHQIWFTFKQQLQIYQQMRTYQTHILIVLSIAVCVNCISMPGSKQKVNQRAKTVVDINRYYSVEHKQANYNISNMVQGQPLIFTLLRTNKIAQIIKEGLTINFKAENLQLICPFKKITDLCVIPSVPKDLTMKISCENLPCEVEWKIYQPTPLAPLSRQSALNLYNLQSSKTHLIGEITCNDPQLSTLDEDTIVYSQTSYVRAYYNNVVYLLFNTFEKGYVYIDVGDNTKNCAQISFSNAPDNIQISVNQTVKDFATKASKTMYQISEIPKEDFLVQCEALRLDSFGGLKYNLQVSLIGVKDGKQQHISKAQIRQISSIKSSTVKLYFKKAQNQYNKLFIQFFVQDGQIFLLNFNLVPALSSTLQLGDTIYFNLHKGESIDLRVNGDEDSEASDQYYLLQKRKQEIKLSPETCKATQGCNVTISALSDTQNMVYVSSQQYAATALSESDGKGLYEFQEVEFIAVKHSFKHKIKLGESIFLRKQLKTGKSYKIQVNSGNVLLYAAQKTKCTVPDSRCRERTGNFHHPFVYEAKADGQLLINVQGLDNAEFQLTIIDNDSIIELSDAVPFSYNMDEAEDSIQFNFTLKEKSDASFNLIAPLNQLKLTVSYPTGKNQNELETSSDGYIQISKQSLTKLNFNVRVQKSRVSERYSSHFTLIASSSKSQLRLQPTVTHYQTISANKQREYVFEFSNSEDYVLSFSVYNLKQNINFELLYSKDQKWDPTNSIKIQKEVQFIELNDIAQMLCEQQRTESCQIFIKISNHMSLQVDYAVILLTKNAVIQLKDGIWQNFPANQMVTSSSFYFYPRHNQHNLLLFYHSILTNLRVIYKLWRYDTDGINPSTWPFPFIVDPSQKTQSEFKKSNFISIDKQQIEKICWPNCVLLVNFYIEADPTLPYNYYESSQFKIMASNNQIELPERHKTSFTLGKQEDREIMVDLKYPLTKNTLTFYTSQTIGQCTISANLYSQKNQRCPIVDETSDFTLNWGQFPIQVSKIKENLKSKNMQDDKNLYLCVAVHSENSCKISMEYTAQDDLFKQIYVDTFEDIKLQSNQTKYYQIDGAVQHYSKIARIKGFPFVFLKSCNDKAELDKCKEDFINSNQKGKQIIVKTQSLDQPACLTCTLLIKFSTIEPSEFSFHSQSKYSQMELKEKVTISDFLNENEVNKYQIHASKEQDLIVNIHVQEGNIEVKMTDGAQLNLLKSSNITQRILQFIIKANKQGNKQAAAKQGLINPLALSASLTIYHLLISSTIKDKASSYSVAYSSGKRQFFLQDGLIVDYQLQSNKPHSFYYCNPVAKEHIFFTVSTQSPEFLKKLKIQALSFEDFSDQSQKKSIDINKPANLNKKTPNPTLMFELNSQNCIELKLINPTAHTESVSMGVNHQEVVFLPFNHQYPFLLHPNEYLNILADVNIPGFIDLDVRKCDQSTPILAYTFDYDGFIKGEYLYQAMLTEQSSFKYHIKANRIGTLYLKIQAGSQSTTATIKMIYSESKPKQSIVRAGNHGIMQYQIIDSKNAKIIFSPVECSDCKNIKYMAVSSQSEDNLYHQMVCPSTYFSVTKLANKINIPTNANQKEEISFTFGMESAIQYVGVMAVTASGQEIFYKPIQIGSLWSKWEQNSTGHQLMMVLILLLVFCVLAIWMRRMSRRGYKPLNEAAE